MSSKELKRITIRLYNRDNIDLIDRAINLSGRQQAEWIRDALIQTAEFQVIGGGKDEVIIKNLLLMRRVVISTSQINPAKLDEMKLWALEETGKLLDSIRSQSENDQ